MKQIDIVNAALSPLASTSAALEGISGYALWEFHSGEWQLSQDLSKSGFQVSGPPASPGAFDGQLRAIVSEPAEPALV